MPEDAVEGSLVLHADRVSNGLSVLSVVLFLAGAILFFQPWPREQYCPALTVEPATQSFVDPGATPYQHSVVFYLTNHSPAPVRLLGVRDG